MKTDYGRLYLIPTPLGDYAPSQVLPAPVFEIICGLKTFVVEEVRTARRFLSAAGLKGQIEGLDFHELNEHTNPAEVDKLKALFANGNNVGLLSEAGLPAVADPGALLVDLCHREGIEVIPLVGPSSLMLALMASGLFTAAPEPDFHRDSVPQRCSSGRHPCHLQRPHQGLYCR